MIRQPALVTLVVLVAACSSGTVAAAIAPSGDHGAASPAVDAPQTPLRVRWNVLSDRNGHVVAEAVVERRAVLRFPVVVRVEAPEGLSLVSGRPQFTVPVDGQTGAMTIPMEFAYSGSAPKGDLKLLADAGDLGIGIHASDVYRFGRRVEAKKPESAGPRMQLGDKDLGPAIPLPSSK